MSTYVKKFEDIPDNLMEWLRDTATENSCTIDKCIWQHKEDDSITYDTKPATPEMYKFVVTVKSSYMENLKFLDYLVKSKLQTITFLQSCLVDKK